LLDTLTSDDFAARVDEPFETSIDGAPVVLQLVNVDVMDERYSPPGARRSFSLTFHGPTAPLLPQGTYTLGNATLGPLSVFIVPLGPVDGALRYEVVFN
jgi:hypothetical protein